MTITEMDENECRTVLARASMGRLGCSLDNQPYVLPIYFAYEADEIYVFATFGQKIEWMRANPKVCVETEEITSQYQWVSVIANGNYQELTESRYPAEYAQAHKLLENRYRWWLSALAERRLNVSDAAIAPLFFRIHITSVTGLRAVPDGDEAGDVQQK
jgi:nitroimidazol reductase NimA-like FMN-containing flavoprotein (pyridoxamine 5'-phosphate oxidase superfamily)